MALLRVGGRRLREAASTRFEPEVALPKSVNLWRVLSEPFRAVFINGCQSSFMFLRIFSDNATFRFFRQRPMAPETSGAKFALDRSQRWQRENTREAVVFLTVAPRGRFASNTERTNDKN
jgi:hypothetical protein